MADLLFFSRNRSTSVEQIDQHTIRSSCRLQDTMTEAYVEIDAKLPDLEIQDVRGEITRSTLRQEFKVDEVLKKVVGIRVGPGILKIIPGLLGKGKALDQLSYMVEECCHGVILSFTKDVLLKAPKDRISDRAYYANMVKENIRLYNRCAAFAPGSPLVEGIEPP